MKALLLAPLAAMVVGVMSAPSHVQQGIVDGQHRQPTGYATDPMCVTHTWTQVFGGTVPIPMRESAQVCRGDDGAWFQCALPAVPCHPIPDQGPAPLPGATPAPGINGSGWHTDPVS
jgi:hypothetical protein